MFISQQNSLEIFSAKITVVVVCNKKFNYMTSVSSTYLCKIIFRILWSRVLNFKITTKIMMNEENVLEKELITHPSNTYTYDM